ncbi:hemagglutinin/protease, zinc metalloprotease [Legionella taurinensis]|nr:hemagglutinin/protease, zinc metalloprotease [Legionella taurinensis]
MMTALTIDLDLDMLKKIAVLSLGTASPVLMASNAVDLYQAPLSSLNSFSLIQPQAHLAAAKKIAPQENALQQISQTRENNKTITRFQQLYKGIPVIGAQVMVAKSTTAALAATAEGEVNGQLINELDLNTQPALSANQAIAVAKKDYQTTHTSELHPVRSELQIRMEEPNTPRLVYLVAFKTVESNKPAQPTFVIDAQSGTVLSQWNDVKTYGDSGPGGNEKVHEYWYGKDGLPALEVTQRGDTCIMDDSKVRLVNLNSKWDWDDKIMTPHQYPCNANIEETVNGAYSPTDDAYYFGHTIIDMYKDWYGVNALQNTKGKAIPLVMRVHFGDGYDNAFWDGQAMSFGDGTDFYPLVSLDVAGHEVTHGFTEQHAGLEYHDQPGALNESLSDMGGQATRAYLLEKNPLLFSKTNLNPTAVTWGIGETVVKDSFGKALRFMDYPSSDGSSADCLDKTIARSSGSYCAISYPELVAFAKSRISDPQDQQSFIVHTASGVFNKAFYLLSQKIGIKKAYHAMVVANTRYWTPTTDFKNGACGVLYAANDLKLDLKTFKTAFAQVGVMTTQCRV